MTLIGQEIGIEYVDPATLAVAPYNPREVSDEALGRLASLMDSHGWVDPVIARREDRLVIGGHQRLKANALRQTPDRLVPVVFLDQVSDARAKALNVALNNSQTQGDYDYPKLADVLREIDTGGLDVGALTGFSQYDLAELLHPGAPGDEYTRDAQEDIEIGQSFQVAAECETEQAQRELYERLTREGYTCRLSVL